MQGEEVEREGVQVGGHGRCGAKLLEQNARSFAAAGEMDVTHREQRGRKQAVGAVKLKRIKVAASRK